MEIHEQIISLKESGLSDRDIVSLQYVRSKGQIRPAELQALGMSHPTQVTTVKRLYALGLIAYKNKRREGGKGAPTKFITATETPTPANDEIFNY